MPTEVKIQVQNSYCTSTTATTAECSLPKQPHRSPVYGTGTGGIIDIALDASAPLVPNCRDVICGPHKYCSMQPGNITLNNLVLDRHAGYKAIDAYDYDGKAAYVFKIVTEIELSGARFVVREGPDQFTLATDKLKKMTVQRRLRRKEKGSKRSAPAPESALVGPPPKKNRLTNDDRFLVKCNRLAEFITLRGRLPGKQRLHPRKEKFLARNKPLPEKKQPSDPYERENAIFLSNCRQRKITMKPDRKVLLDSIHAGILSDVKGVPSIMNMSDSDQNQSAAAIKNIDETSFKIDAFLRGRLGVERQQCASPVDSTPTTMSVVKLQKN